MIGTPVNIFRAPQGFTETLATHALIPPGMGRSLHNGVYHSSVTYILNRYQAVGPDTRLHLTIHFYNSWVEQTFYVH
jgi:hypothetical protein